MTNPRWEEIRPKFKALRDEYGLNSLSRATGASRSSIDRWARGISRPQPAHIRACAHVVAASERSQMGRNIPAP